MNCIGIGKCFLGFPDVIVSSFYFERDNMYNSKTIPKRKMGSDFVVNPTPSEG